MVKSFYFEENNSKIKEWRREGKIKFSPPIFTLNIFPPNCLDNYIINNNHKKWAQLVKEADIYKLEGEWLEKALESLMKIYYALGGFSKEEKERNKAYAYVLENVVKYNSEFSPRVMVSDIDLESQLSEKGKLMSVAYELYDRFGEIELTGEHNKTFSQFFMKYYHKDHDFMKDAFFSMNEEEDVWAFMRKDNISDVCNRFDNFIKRFPNHRVNSNGNYDAITPQFVAKHYREIGYKSVHEGNEKLAELIGKYGYNQTEFEKIQEIFDNAKKCEGSLCMELCQDNEKSNINFRFLKKDDPLGFVIGDITNCCQFMGGIADSCVKDGYENPNAGFLLFEEVKGKERRILGQAYVWYDEESRIVCYDSIEVPKSIVKEMGKGSKITIEDFLLAVRLSASATIKGMNKNGHKVEKVILGKFSQNIENKIKNAFLKQSFNKEKYNLCYTDLKDKVYVIRDTKEDINLESGLN